MASACEVPAVTRSVPFTAGAFRGGGAAGARGGARDRSRVLTPGSKGAALPAQAGAPGQERLGGPAGGLSASESAQPPPRSQEPRASLCGGAGWRVGSSSRKGVGRACCSRRSASGLCRSRPRPTSPGRSPRPSPFCTDSKTAGFSTADSAPSTSTSDSGGEVKLLESPFAGSARIGEAPYARAMRPSLRYLPPEIGAGKSGDARSDLYMLGVLLEEMLGAPGADDASSERARRAGTVARADHAAAAQRHRMTVRPVRSRSDAPSLHSPPGGAEAERRCAGCWPKASMSGTGSISSGAGRRRPARSCRAPGASTPTRTISDPLPSG